MTRSGKIIKAASLLAVLSLVMVSLYSRKTDPKAALSLIKLGEPAARKIDPLTGDYPGYRLWDIQNQALGYATITKASGYGGKITVLTVIDTAGVIKKVTLLDNFETPAYLNKVTQYGLIDQYTGKPIARALTGVDSVSGATVTSRGIIAATNKGLIQIGNNHLDMNLPLKNSIRIAWQDLAVSLLVILASVFCVKKINAVRPWFLITSVILIGFTANYSLSYSSYVALFSGNYPAIIERPVWCVLVPGILIITILFGKNVYCRHLCPFGAVQEGLYKSMNLFRFSPSLSLKSKARKARWVVLWVVAFSAILLNTPGAASYEPFSVFFDGYGNTSQWIIMAIMLILSMAQSRFWCRYFCPVGAILDFVSRLRKKQKQVKLKESETQSPLREQGFPDIPKQAISKGQDRFFIGLIITVNSLIIISFLESTGWIN